MGGLVKPKKLNCNMKLYWNFQRGGARGTQKKSLP